METAWKIQPMPRPLSSEPEVSDTPTRAPAPLLSAPSGNLIKLSKQELDDVVLASKTIYVVVQGLGKLKVTKQSLKEALSLSEAQELVYSVSYDVDNSAITVTVEP